MLYSRIHVYAFPHFVSKIIFLYIVSLCFSYYYENILISPSLPFIAMCHKLLADVNFCQDLLCTSKNNEMFLSMIHEGSSTRLQLERRKGWIQGGALFDLGPVLYNKQVFKHLFLENDAYSKCEHDVSNTRELISNTNGIIVTKRETDCDDGLLVDETLPECYERGDLYNAYGMKAWGPEVNKIWDD